MLSYKPITNKTIETILTNMFSVTAIASIYINHLRKKLNIKPNNINDMAFGAISNSFSEDISLNPLYIIFYEVNINP